MRLVPALLLIMAGPLGAEPAPQPVPQPVLLDWTDQFRLYAPPNNAGAAELKPARDSHSPKPRANVPEGSIPGPREIAGSRLSSRRSATDGNRLSLPAQVGTGPVSLGASYGKYRASPAGHPNREISADDMRVSLGIAF